jgi:hypothetical protein
MSDVVFFSPSTCGAYTVEMHGAGMPGDVVEVPADDWQLLLNELAGSAKRMGARVGDGYPILIDPPPLDLEQLESIERAWRDAQLLPTDTLVSRHRDELERGGTTTLTTEQYAELQDYRRQLRDWPQGTEFPLVDHRPVAPPWLSGQEQ